MSKLLQRSAVLVIASSALLGACEEYGIPAGTSPHRELNFLDMGDQPKIKAQRGDLIGNPDMAPPEGAIPRGFTPYLYHNNPEAAAAKLKNPLADDNSTVARGKVGFERYCVPCHGQAAAGDGTVVKKGFPPPPSLMTQKVRDWPDGRLYHIISEGQNIMPSYAAQVRVDDRWAIIKYVRRMQSEQPVAPAPPNAAPTVSPASSAVEPPSSASVPNGSATPSGSVSPATSSSSEVNR